MPVSGPEKCPECGHGPLLPLSPGCCPECGFEYDEHTRIWRPRRPWRIYLVFANALLFSPWFFRLLQVTLRHGQWPSRSVIIGAGLSLILLLWALPRIRVLLSEGHRYAAVTPRGVQARTPKGQYVVPWEELDAVTVVLGVPLVRWRDAKSARMLDWIFDTDEEVRDFVSKVEADRQRYPRAGTRSVEARPAGTV